MGLARHDPRNATLPATEMREILAARFDLVREENGDNTDPARGWVCRKSGARAGFISSMSENFCDSCNRMRLTAQGGLRPCLHQDAEVEVRTILRAGENDEVIEKCFRDAANLKWAGHHMNDVIPLHSVKEMVAIGG